MLTVQAVWRKLNHLTTEAWFTHELNIMFSYFLSTTALLEKKLT